MVFSFFLLRGFYRLSHRLGHWACRSDILFIWWFRLRSITVLYLLLLSVPEPIEGRFLFLPVISAPLNHRLIFTTTPGAWACRRHIFIPPPVISTPLNQRIAFGAWACRRHILILIPVISTPLNQRFAFGAWACRRHNISILIRIIFW